MIKYSRHGWMMTLSSDGVVYLPENLTTFEKRKSKCKIVHFTVKEHKEQLTIP
jgi:serine phosphatase RsbU (regulator of sigma subunit)